MIVIGITGGIGAGKSRVLYLLKNEYSAFVLEADKLAKELMMPGRNVYYKVAEAFPEAVPVLGNPIDSSRLSAIVYNDIKSLTVLNSIVHPAVKEEVIKRIDEVREEDKHKLFFIEAALLIEGGYKSICDEMWYIRTDEEIRIKRLIEFRNMDYEGAVRVISNQKNDEYYTANSDFVIDNSGSFEETERQISERVNLLGGF